MTILNFRDVFKKISAQVNLRILFQLMGLNFIGIKDQCNHLITRWTPVTSYFRRLHPAPLIGIPIDPSYTSTFGCLLGAPIFPFRISRGPAHLVGIVQEMCFFTYPTFWEVREFLSSNMPKCVWVRKNVVPRGLTSHHLRRFACSVVEQINNCFPQMVVKNDDLRW